MNFYILLVSGLICLITWASYKLLKKVNLQVDTDDGKFFVNGVGEVVVDLCCDSDPTEITVEFCDDFDSHPCHPCNPASDTLDWELVEGSECNQLIISYNVGNVREISYHIIY